VIKATYMLTTRACLGARLRPRDRVRRPHAVRADLGLILAVAALVSLRFAVFGSPLGGLL
jgi:hypothetical protein